MAVLKHTGAPGVSAPQIGIPVRMALVRLEDGSFQDLINPEISAMYGVETTEPEWCLSVPPHGNCGKTPRMQIIEIRSGVASMRFQMRFKGKNSRVIQHEIDHLNGTMFLDRLMKKDYDQVIEKFREWKTSQRLAKLS